MADKLELASLIRAKKVELANINAELETLEPKINQLSAKLRNVPIMCEKEIRQAEQNARNKFEENRSRVLSEIAQECANRKTRVQELLSAMPGSGREFAGKYEVNELEDALAEKYPRALVEGFVPVSLDVMEDEGQAYAQYSDIQRRILTLRSASLVGVVFDSLTSLLEATTDKSSVVKQRLSIGVIAIAVIALAMMPHIFMISAVLVGLTSLAYGVYVRRILADLCEVKNFLNESYNEDIFNQGCRAVTRNIENFIDTAQEEYSAEVSKWQFKMDETVFDEIRARHKADESRIDSMLNKYRTDSESMSKRSDSLMDEIEELEQKAKNWASTAVELAFDKVNWKREWLSSFIVDVTQTGTIKQSPLSAGNTLYVSKESSHLQQLSQLLVHQVSMQMHPMFARQVAIDYKDLGGKLVMYRKLPTMGFTLDTETDGINAMLERCTTEVQQRVNKIYSTCDSLDAFNAIISKYGGEGDPYVIVHVLGLKNFNDMYTSLLTNGPKAGYFFKLYMTVEELNEVAKSMSFNLFADSYLVSDNIQQITSAQLQRILKQAS